MLILRLKLAAVEFLNQECQTDDSRVSKAFSGVCVCAYLCSHDKTKQMKLHTPNLLHK